jgi:RNA polymerase sigma-70 factor, ECF subfamily
MITRFFLFILGTIPKGEIFLDPKIILAAQRGENEAIEMLVKHHQGYVYRLICRQVRNPSWAEDLTQDVFIRAFRSLHSLSEPHKFTAWLTRIALNVCSSWFVSKQYRSYFTEAIEDNLLASQPQSISAEEIFDLKRIITLIGDLDAKYREVIALCLLESYSYSEAAEILDIPIGTVASRMHTALKSLRTKNK